MNNIYLILYILVLLILIILFYNRMLKEHFNEIEKVTEICNTRKKINMETCSKDISGEKGIEGEIGRIGSVGAIGKVGETGASGRNGYDAKDIGSLTFSDYFTDKYLGVHDASENTRPEYRKNTNVKLLRGEYGDNARMNPITFIDDSENVISKEHVENNDLYEIKVRINNGEPGPKGNDAVCTTPGRQGNQGPVGDKGNDSDQGVPGNSTDIGPPGDIIANPEFDMISVDEFCVKYTDGAGNKQCINNDQYSKFHRRATELKRIVDAEQRYNVMIEDISNRMNEIEKDCPFKQREQFANMENLNCNNNFETDNEYCAKIVQGDRGANGVVGDDGFKGPPGQTGARGLNGLPGMNGTEIPNIDFIDKNTDILLGKYKSFSEDAETKNIYLNSGTKGLPAYIPNLKFIFNGENIESATAPAEHEQQIEPISIYLDNSKGQRGEEGENGICILGQKGDDGPDGPKGYDGPPAQRGVDALPGEKGEPGPQTLNPTYNEINAVKYCFANEQLSDICLDSTMMGTLIANIENPKYNGYLIANIEI